VTAASEAATFLRLVRAGQSPEELLRKKRGRHISLGEFLAYVRQQAGLSQHEMAQRIGSHQQNVSAAERTGAHATWATVQKILAAGGYAADDTQLVEALRKLPRKA